MEKTEETKTVILTRPLKGPKEQPIMGPGNRPLTLVNCCIQALEQCPLISEEDTKLTRGELGFKIAESDGPIELTHEELDLIKQAIEAVWTPMAVVSAWRMLDPKKICYPYNVKKKKEDEQDLPEELEKLKEEKPHGE